MASTGAATAFARRLVAPTRGLLMPAGSLPAGTPVTASLVKTIVGTYFDTIWNTAYSSSPMAQEIWPTGAPIIDNWGNISCTFENCPGGVIYPYTPTEASYIQQIVNTWDRYYPPRTLAEPRSLGGGLGSGTLLPWNGIASPRSLPRGITPLSNATTIADAAAIIGGIAGIGAALALSLPVDIGATAGLVIVGLAAYVYASLNPSLQPSDLATAMSDAAWPGGQAGAAADLVARLGGISKLSGLGPYGFLAGGVIGGLMHELFKYYPSFRNPQANGRRDDGTRVVIWDTAPTVWTVTVSFYPCPAPCQ